MNKTLFFLVVFIGGMAAFSTTGCVSRRIIAFSDHTVSPVTKIETFKVKRFGSLVLNTQHEFWVCSDEGEVLRCDKKCGKGTDLACPPYLSYAGGTQHTRNGGGNVAPAPDPAVSETGEEGSK